MHRGVHPPVEFGRVTKSHSAKFLFYKRFYGDSAFNHGKTG